MLFPLRSIFAAFTLFTIAPAWSDVVLVDQKQALPITIHPEAGEELRLAVADLARVLGQMGGVTPIVSESREPSGIVVGTIEQFGVFKDDPALAIRGKFDGREAYIIRPEDANQRVWILGNREDGASHGIYSLLREYGYRALFPGKNWEVIPKRPSVVVSAPSEGRPKVLTRMIWAGFGSFDKEQTRDMDAWRRRNRLGASISGQIGHSWESIIRNNREAFEANPNLFGEKADGSLNRSSLRHGTKEVVDITLAHFAKRLSDPRQADIFSLAPTDGDNYTRDKETAARGEMHESYYWYVNEVARQTASIAPGHLVGTTAYYLHAKPPGFDLEPNVIVLAATMFGSGGMTLEDFFSVWSKRTRYLGVRDYIYSGYSVHADHPDGGFQKATLERQAKWLKDFPVVYYSAEGLWEFGVRGVGYYALAQLLWDPGQALDGVLADFHASAYGAAAGTMASYFETMEPQGRKVQKFQLARAVKLVEKAATELQVDPDAAARLNDIKLYLVHAALLDKMRALKPSDPERLRLASQDLEWNYRNRRSYMLNYNCNRRFWMVNGNLLGGFFNRDRNQYSLRGEEKPKTQEEQDAVIARTLGSHWKLTNGIISPKEEGGMSAEVTGAEIEAKFAEIVVPQYPEIDVEEIAYSNDYAPVDTGLEVERESGSALWFGANTKLAIWRNSASRISWQVTPNVRYPGKVSERPFEILAEFPDGTNSEVISLVQDSEPKKAEIELNQPGISVVAFDSKRQGFLLEGENWDYMAIPTDADTVLFIGSNAANRTHVNAPIYFYVPKGTKEIQIYADLPDRLLKNSRINPVGESGTPALVTGELIRIAVAPGHDGKVWEVTGGGLGVRFYFLNLPNILSLHPGKMLLPRELVEKDGLKEVTE